MPSPTDSRVDAYISAAAPFAQPILQHLRKLVHAACPDVVETLKWNAPAFTLDGKILCNMAAFKAHVAFGFWHQEMEKLLKRELGKTDEAMGLLGRITTREDLPDDRVLTGYVKKAAELTRSGAPSRAKKPASKNAATLETPADLDGALKRNRRAAAVWEKFTPGKRKDYVEWITEAKRPETRARRLETALEWISEGKARNWKYEKC